MSLIDILRSFVKVQPNDGKSPSADQFVRAQLALERSIDSILTFCRTLVPPAGIATEYLADGAVTTAKLASSAVTTAKIADNAVTDANLRDSAALSVIGNSADTSGNPGDIAGAANQVLRVNTDGTELGFGYVDASSVTGLGALIGDDVLDLLAYALNRIDFIEQALRISHTQRSLETPAALTLLEDRLKWM